MSREFWNKFWNRYKITTKKGLIFELIIEDWLKPGEYYFGKIELIETLSKEQKEDYIETEENIMRLWNINFSKDIKTT